MKKPRIMLLEARYKRLDKEMLSLKEDGMNLMPEAQ